MRSILAIGLILALVRTAPSFAQGVLPDPPARLEAAPVAEAFRGVLAPRVDLSPMMPPPRAQRFSRTCVSWSVTYAAASDALRRADPAGKMVPLSPAFSYVLAGGSPNCQRATSIARTLDVLRTIGALPLDQFAFDASACTREPTARELRSAARWRIKGWSKIDPHDIDAVKGQLARGRPVIFAMDVGPKFHAHRGDGVIGTLDTGTGLEGRAMVLVGYDDTRAAFRLQNSAGREWGDGGYAWIGYPAWQKAVHEAVVID